MTAPGRTVNSMLLEAARARNNTYQQHLEAARSISDRLESEVEQFRARVAVRDHTIRDLRADLATQLEAARATIERLESEACQFRARVAIRDNTIRDLRADLRTARGTDE